MHNYYGFNIMKMKILIINQNFNMFAGTEVISTGTYDILKNNGHDVYYFAFDKKPYYIENYEYSKYFPKNNLSTIEYLKNPFKYYWNYEAANKLHQVILAIKPDIIHIHSLMSPSILKVCKKNNIPTVMTLHIMPPICPSTTFLYKNKKICKDFKCKNGNYWHCILNKCGNGSIERSIRKTISSYLFNKTDAYSAISYFICPSNAMRDVVRSSNITKDKNKIITINNFLSTKELKIIPKYTNEGYFLYIGRLSPEKGVHYLLEAMRDLPREIKLKIAGTGTEEEKLKKFANTNNLDNVEFLGFKNREEVNDLYQNCISTILPCNWFEIFGMTNIESFINGKPVIASNIGGIPEIVEDNINGLLFEPSNVEQLKECILKYWNNPDLAVEHGKNGYQKAITQYTEERYYSELMKVYEEVLDYA